MKLSRTGWNNVIIFSVMLIILLINMTNDKIFPNEGSINHGERSILPEHAVILTLSFNISEEKYLLFERVARSWKLTTQGMTLDKTELQIEQMIFAWQQSLGLVQAAEIVIDNARSITVQVALANESEMRTLILYPLHNQLLVYQQQEDIWLALPAALAKQLIPINL